MNEKSLQFKSLTVLLVLVTVAFIWILLPFYGAVFWAVILGILFAPVQRRLQQKFGWQRNVTSLCTLSLCLVIAILPVIIVSILLVQEGATVYKNIESGELDIAAYLAQFKHSLPPYFQHLLDRFGMGELDSLREKIVKAAMQGSQALATQAFSFGQGTFEFVVSFFIMLYLLFFFLRDGPELARKMRTAVPLEENHKRRLQLKFNRVVRATVKGNVVVAVTQGALGGLIFWFLDIPSALLWAVLMAFLSLLPAVGAGIVWAPVAVYFLLSGMIWQGVVLGLFGVFVIGLVDNVLRPILVGKDTKMPDYLILVSTLGGLAVFGLNGFVIGPLIAALFLSSWALFVETKPKVQLP
ncbi:MULTISPECIES: AI-2E family transporter [Pseudomonas]|jgi:predicted PurR-regulated permease PerM|uniref:AI-2E family transporter n=1 Tax=Pseudomonas TaxID=286 RepID=UPI0008CB924B|nr:AI-2E family transporter [Pseudomonas atacamensis]OFJ43886.1 AI-2E family transporter [Pseudomonas koreensis]RON74926.1 AI-2E family transporter [Pseudomonas fluorescens]MDH2078739.1 AI-2E family transporter [Pseudomonas atacamensis]MDT6922601.1 AI-2E family transporter [Pseudomonas atacamensis]MEB2858282.1 AI-2E family transporter [Pseudomonas atacamensis]